MSEKERNGKEQGEKERIEEKGIRGKVRGRTGTQDENGGQRMKKEEEQKKKG